MSSKPRLNYDFARGPYLFAHDDCEIAVNEAADASVLNIGLTAYPILETASGNVVNIRSKFTHTTGDARNIYNRAYLYGSAGGESLRCFTSVMANLNDANGAHVSLNFVATAGGSECSGTGTAIKGTLHIPDIASWAPAGTLAAGMFEIYSDGTASDPAGLTELSVLRLCNSGGSGKADVDTDAFLFSIQGFTAAADTTKVLSSVSLAELPANSVALKIKIGAGTYWLLAVADAQLN